MDRKILIYYTKCEDTLYLSHVSNLISYNFYFDDDYDVLDNLVENDHESAIRKLKILTKDNKQPTTKLGRPSFSLKKIYHNIGVLYVIIDNKTKALKYFNKAIELNNYLSYRVLGHYYHNIEKDYNTARNYFEKYLQATKQEGSVGLARIYAKFKDFSNALKHYKLCVKQNSVIAILELAEFYNKNKMHSKAEKYYDKVKKYSCVHTNFGLASYYKNNKSYDDMITHLRKGVEWNCPSSMGMLGNYYRIQSMQQAQTLTHHSTLILNKFTELAEKYLQMAINVGSYYSVNEFALLRLDQKRYDDALGYFHMAVEYKSSFAALKLGRHYESIFDHENTIKYYKLSIQFGNGKTRNDLGYYYNTKKMFLEETKLAVEYLDKFDCKCTFRNKCNFNCSETKDKVKDMQKKLNTFLNNGTHTSINTHEDYFTMLQIARKYLNPNILKVLNDYLCIQYHNINETVNEDECPVCLTETNKILQLYCCHKICYVCYPSLRNCPLCNCEI